MKFLGRSTPRQLGAQNAGVSCVAILFALFACTTLHICAETPAPQQETVGSADQQLQSLLSAQQSSVQSGVARRILSTSQELAAFTLRLLAGLDLARGDLAKASERYQQSLAIHDSPDVRLELAISYIMRKDADHALTEAAKVTAQQPEYARAWSITGEALLLKKDIRAAADALARSLYLKPDMQTALILVTVRQSLNQKDESDRLLEQIKGSLGDSAQLHLLLANAYHQAGDLSATISELNKAIELDPRIGALHLALGNAYWELNEYQYNADALRAFAESQKLDPADYFSNYDLGAVESQYGLYEQATTHLELAANVKPSTPDPLIQLGINAYAQGYWAQARTYLEKAVELNGKQEGGDVFQVRRAYLVLSRLATQDGRMEEAQKLFGDAERLHQEMLKEEVPATLSESNGLTTNLTRPQAPRGGTPANPNRISGGASSSELQARERELLEIAANSLNDAGTALARTRDYAAALPFFRQAAKVNPDLLPAVRNMGIAAFHVGAYDESVSALSRALGQNPQDALSRAYLGMSMFNLNRFAESATAFSTLGREIVSNATFASTYALALARSHQPAAANSVLNELVSATPTAAVLVAVAGVYIELEDFDRANSSAQSALQADPNIPGAHAAAGRALLGLHRPADAISELNAELRVIPETDRGRLDTKVLLASAFLMSGQKAEALSVVKDINAAHPEYAVLRQKLGEDFLKAGAAKPAVENLRAAMLLNPAAPELRRELSAALSLEGTSR